MAERQSQRPKDGPEPELGLPAELLDALHSALVVADREGNILLWNTAAEQLYGYPREQMQGSNVMRLFVAGEQLDAAAGIMQQVLEGRTWTGEFPVACADGRQKLVRITDSPLMRDGQVVAIVGLAEEVVHDNSTSTEALSDLAWALAELDGLRTAMKTRGTIEQAKGIVMVSLGVDDSVAFDVLRRMSQRSHRKLIDVAAEIVERASSGGQGTLKEHLGFDATQTVAGS